MDEKYKEYIHSKKWSEKAARIKRERKYTCELCRNHILLEVVVILADADHSSWDIPEIKRFAEAIFERSGNRDRLIEVHHKTYKNIYNEWDDELACLCRPCHVFCSENAVGNSEEEAWRKTQTQVLSLLKTIKNKPNGIKEFDLIPKSSAEWILIQHGF